MNEVVRGEASESEDETLGLIPEQKRILAAEVTGEASEESEEDLYENGNMDSKYNVDSLYKNNLLQRKLIENNLLIWRSLNMFVKNIVTTASKQLLTTDQLLIKSQNSTQSVLVILNQAQLNIKQLSEKTEAVFTTSFIPNINIQTNKPKC